MVHVLGHGAPTRFRPVEGPLGPRSPAVGHGSPSVATRLRMLGHAPVMRGRGRGSRLTGVPSRWARPWPTCNNCPSRAALLITQFRPNHPPAQFLLLYLCRVSSLCCILPSVVVPHCVYFRFGLLNAFTLCFSQKGIAQECPPPSVASRPPPSVASRGYRGAQRPVIRRPHWLDRRVGFDGFGSLAHVAPTRLLGDAG